MNVWVCGPLVRKKGSDILSPYLPKNKACAVNTTFTQTPEPSLTSVSLDFNLKQHVKKRKKKNKTKETKLSILK